MRPEIVQRFAEMFGKAKGLAATDSPSTERNEMMPDDTRILPAVQYVGVIEMPPAEWAVIAENPRQRDTEKRARKAKYLHTPHPTHRAVNMAILPDGRRIKLDGHTRSYLWQNGQDIGIPVSAPAVLAVTVWWCSTLAAACDLYQTFDSQGAVESPQDQLFGAKREQNAQFTSPYFKDSTFSSGLRLAYEALFGQPPARGASTYELLRYWMPEMRLLDPCGPTRTRFCAGLVAAALLSLRRYGPRVVGFWEFYSAGTGIKMGDKMDAVESLNQRMLQMKADRQITGRRNVNEIIRRTFNAIDGYLDGREYSARNEDQKGIRRLNDNSYRRWIAAAKEARRDW